MLFRKNDSDDLFSKLKDDNNDNGDSNPSRSTRALRILKRKSTLSFFFFITESLWKQPMSEKFYLSSWFYFKRIPLCVSTRTRGREL